MRANKMKRGFAFAGGTALILNAALFLFLTLTTETFFSYSNIYSVFYGISIQAVALLGFTYLMILGEIDLSVGAVYGCAGTVCSLFNMVLRLPFFLSLLITVTLFTAFGYFLGYLVVRFELNSMMVTLGAMTLIIGANAILFGVAGPGIYPEAFRDFAKVKLFGIHWTIYLLVLLMLVTEFAQRRTVLFKKLFLTGSNLESARIYGIRSGRIKRSAFALSCMASSFAGVIAAARITHSDLATGTGLEIIFITSAVIGGVKLTGGTGSYLSAVLGLIFLTFMNNGMLIYKINPLWQQVAVGVILILAVYADVAIKKLAGRVPRAAVKNREGGAA